MLAEQSARLQPWEAARDEMHAPEARCSRSIRPSSSPSIRRSNPGPTHPLRRRPRGATLQANPLVVAVAIAITGVSLLVASDRLAVDRLTVHRIASSDAPLLDGDTSDRVWRNIQPFTLVTHHGGNFDGKGETRIDIRAVHDGTWAYFLFTWDDPTRSLKHLPLIKEADGWHLLHNGFENGDERDFNEDKFSVLFTRADVTIAGDRTFHASPQPLADKPATMTGRGLHYTHWRHRRGRRLAVEGDQRRPGGLDGRRSFRAAIAADAAAGEPSRTLQGGYAPDPGNANYSDNFVAGAAADTHDRAAPPAARSRRDEGGDGRSSISIPIHGESAARAGS